MVIARQGVFSRIASGVRLGGQHLRRGLFGGFHPVKGTIVQSSVSRRLVRTDFPADSNQPGPNDTGSRHMTVRPN
jgi:hypothetical protein